MKDNVVSHVDEEEEEPVSEEDVVTPISSQASSDSWFRVPDSTNLEGSSLNQPSQLGDATRIRTSTPFNTTRRGDVGLHERNANVEVKPKPKGGSRRGATSLEEAQEMLAHV